MKNKNRLKELREQKQLTQQDMAQMLGIARSTYTGYEIGNIEIPVEKLQRIAGFFEVSIDYLIGNNHDKFMIWKYQLPFHRIVQKARIEMDMSVDSFAEKLGVTTEEVIRFEKGMLYPATSETLNQIKEILSLSDKDLFENDNITINSSLIEIEFLIKECNHHVMMAKQICEEQKESFSINPSLPAKEYLLTQLEKLSLDELTDLIKYSYSQKISQISGDI